MNSKRDTKRNKPKLEVAQQINQKTFMSPVNKKNAVDAELNPLNLRDLSPYPAVYGSYHTPNHIHFSNTELTIIQTPAAHTFPRMSYLEQIDQGPHPISGIINWENDEEEESENQQDDYDILDMSEEESRKSQIKPSQESNKRQSDRKNNPHLKTAEPKEKKNSQKAIQNTNSTASGSKKVFCNCKKTKCLKLYCDCFRINQTCDGCNCVGCHNLSMYEDERNNAMLTLMDRNPEAFKPKIEEEQHAKGCHCKKSNCLKKYCECFQANLKCGANCKCEDCKNKSEDGGDRNDDNPNTFLNVSLQYSITNQKEKEETKERRPIRTSSGFKDRKIQQWVVQV